MIRCDKCLKDVPTTKDYITKVSVAGQDRGTLLQFLCEECGEKYLNIIIAFAGDKENDRLETGSTPQT